MTHLAGFFRPAFNEEAQVSEEVNPCRLYNGRAGRPVHAHPCGADKRQNRVGSRGETGSSKALDRDLKNLSIAMERSYVKITVGRLPKIMADSTQLTQLLQKLWEIGSERIFTENQTEIFNAALPIKAKTK